ncbi:MAG: type IV pilus assembly protein PilB [Pseudohongiellaceae bacterium]|jgi:type IV pilus assembly protein PilB
MSSTTHVVDRSTPAVLRLLLSEGLLTEDQLGNLRPPRGDTRSLEELAISSGLVSEVDVARVHAKAVGTEYVVLREPEATESEDGEELLAAHKKGSVIVMSEDGSETPLGTILELSGRCRSLADRVSEAVCRTHRVVPIASLDGCIQLACLDPSGYAGIEAVGMLTGSIVRPVAATLTVLNDLTSAVFGERDMVQEIANEGMAVEQSESREDDDEEIENVVDLAKPVALDKDSQVVRIVNVILTRAIESGASDIHLEPYESDVRVRYRIDGKLIETTPPPKNLFIPTISRLKILSKMDIAEKRIPQDGAIALKKGEVRTDLRVSTVPTVYGEKMVIRILDKSGIPDRLQNLGFSDAQAQQFIDAAESPHGLMFVTGPTGSGKSTTLYCCLNLINTPDENIVTVEDPVEYKFRGLNQVHVRSKVGLTFAAALRAFLRQDPDRIMVGEVRDQETAQICLRAALTGHLVLSTLHTNSALQVINRLTDMGIEPFLLGPALRMLEAQRLARRLCSECKVPIELPDDVAERHGLEAGLSLFGPGDTECELCRGNRFKGRVGLYEVVPIGENLREMIAQGCPETELRKVAQGEGTEFLDAAARNALRAGQTSLSEVAEYIAIKT